MHDPKPPKADGAFGGYGQIMQIPVNVEIVVGSLTMPVASVMRLGRGAVLRLDRRIGEAVDVMVNGRLVARGEIVMLEDDPDRMGVSLTEIVGGAPPKADA
ncbi:MAG: flagellar motor switch protein FliN [Beijerinckiaceae bacterium]|nr:flagellar motor switch protein FliN [Beijerinckiaceae bacterium]